MTSPHPQQHSLCSRIRSPLSRLRLLPRRNAARIAIWTVCVLLFCRLPVTISKPSEKPKIRNYPQRHEAEAAVIEWGNSAIISALDAVAADFGPSTSQAALMEVETTPILASPLNGESLQNAEDFLGNVAIASDEVFSGYELAKLFQSHGAAAVLVVHMDSEQPDAIHKLMKPEFYDTEIDIPVVSISWTAANVLSTAVLPEDQRGVPSQILSPDGLPERIRLYAGGDRPFFEDVEAAHPTVYLIHNLLTDAECEELLKVKLYPMETIDKLQYSDDLSYFERTSQTQRAVQWQGLLQWPHQKAMEERIDQVTGFPTPHLSDFIVERVDSGHWKPHYDSLLGSYVPLASITVFLRDAPTAVWKYPQTERSDEIHITPRKGMAIVHHNTDESQRFDHYAVHQLETNGSPVYMARKVVLPIPPSVGRRILLPAVAMLHGGRLPSVFSETHDWLVDRYGAEVGPGYFDMGLLAIPVLIGLAMVQLILYVVRMSTKDGKTANGAKKDTKKD